MVFIKDRNVSRETFCFGLKQVWFVIVVKIPLTVVLMAVGWS
jgi:hypothetical protein